MFRIWGKIVKSNRTLQDMTVEDEREETRTHKIMDSLEKMCYAWDLEKPIWLDSNIREFQRYSKTRFNKDSFIEEVDFDYLEIQILEEE